MAFVIMSWAALIVVAQVSIAIHFQHKCVEFRGQEAREKVPYIAKGVL